MEEDKIYLFKQVIEDSDVCFLVYLYWLRKDFDGKIYETVCNESYSSKWYENNYIDYYTGDYYTLSNESDIPHINRKNYKTYQTYFKGLQLEGDPSEVMEQMIEYYNQYNREVNLNIIISTN